MPHPKILHKYCFQFLLGRLNYGKCWSGVWKCRVYIHLPLPRPQLLAITSWMIFELIIPSHASRLSPVLAFCFLLLPTEPVTKSITQRPIQAGRCCELPTAPLLRKKWNNFKIVKAMANKLGNFFKIIWKLLKVVMRCTLTLTFLWQPSFDSDIFPNLLFSDKKFYCLFVLWYIKIHT